MKNKINDDDLQKLQSLQNRMRSYDYEKMQILYENDAAFYALVNNFTAMIKQLDFTPSELRQAATFASLKVEFSAQPKMYFTKGNKNGN